ncbi:type III secretion inner membrane ring lipoprotein SctJ [Massilia sp. MB5]|uniref:type III secretion system inner membrane ring lipoprotein SctJ n=1 Tax=unclassified Massilia TaxID=2609279 RepID=UPI00067C6CD5|nr:MULTISPECIES: type III secretion inner membrane ring lipoprotein SctJ [unclassified Massilia]AKU22901.1 type III secretion protein [Massilia sp. NR 4-1]UMR32263.1 type III secretion inner membrane ring lipoprotein SctJ [Massilia sp. MB5]
MGKRLCLLFALAALLSGCGKVVVLQASLQDVDANEVVQALTAQGIQVEKRQEKTGVSLTVKEDDLSRATSAMQAAGLPRRNRSNLGEVFKKQGMISSPMEERVRYIHGLSEELEATLQLFDRVLSARVHVVLPERIAPGEAIQPSSAAVFIRYRAPLDEDAVTPRVRRLVSSSIPGLSGEDGRSKVSVVMTPAEAAPPPPAWTMVGPFHVAAESASGLRYALTAMALLVVAGMAAAGYGLLRNHPMLARFGKRRTPAAAQE